MQRAHRLGKLAALAVLLSCAACDVSLSIRVGNTPDSPERKPRITLPQAKDSVGDSGSKRVV